MKNMQTFLLSVCLLLGASAIAQSQIGTIDNLETQVTNTATTVKKIINTIIGICFALGACYLIYAFVTGNERAQRYLALYFAALVIYGLLILLHVL